MLLLFIKDTIWVIMYYFHRFLNDYVSNSPLNSQNEWYNSVQGFVDLTKFPVIVEVNVEHSLLISPLIQRLLKNIKNDD